MLTIDIDPTIFSIGHFGLRWYGVIVAGAIGLAAWMAGREARRTGVRSEDFFDALTWSVAGGLVGARLFHVADHWSHEYAANPLRIVYLWEGGLAIWGAILGGGLALAIFCRRRRMNLWRMADVAAPGLVLAMAIGRVACLITGDAMGPPTDGPIGLAYLNPGAMVPQLGVYYTPMPAYELIVNLGIFAVLWALRRQRWPDGARFALFLGLYGVERFLLAFTSSYRIVALGLTQSQIVALAALAAAIVLGVSLVRRGRMARLA